MKIVSNKFAMIYMINRKYSVSISRNVVDTDSLIC